MSVIIQQDTASKGNTKPQPAWCYTTDPLVLGLSSQGVTNVRIKAKKIKWEDFTTALRKPKIGTKEGSYFTRCAFNNDHRKASNAKTGYVAILDGDSSIDPKTGEITNGAPDPDLVHGVLTKLNVTHAIYSSHSNLTGEKGIRYRVVIPVLMADKEELERVVGWLINQLHDNKVYLNMVSENLSFAQAWYLPRVPDEDHKASFVFLEYDDGQPFPMSKATEYWEEQRPQRAEPKASTIAPVPTKTTAARTDGPIDKFNREQGANSMARLLVEAGYIFTSQAVINGEPAWHFIHPKSTSHSPGVRLFCTEGGTWRVYSHHGDYDPLSGRAEDCFGIYTLFRFNGDSNAAMESIGIYQREIDIKEVNEADLKSQKGSDLVAAYRRQERRRFNDKYGLLFIEGQTVIVFRQKIAGSGQIETKFSKPSAVMTMSANWFIPFVGGSSTEPSLTWKPLYKDWLEGAKRRSYDQPVFAPDPDLPASVVMPPSDGSYNLYVGAQFKPEEGCCDLLLEHIKTTWCSDDQKAYDYVISWLARMVQKPYTQGRTVLVLRSGEGAGKGIILDIFERYYGPHAALLSNPEDLTGFNDHLGTSVFVFLNEALWGGDRKHEGALKTIITDDVLLVERKYMPKIKTRNCTHIVVATNNDWAVPVGVDDRRYLILDLNQEFKDKVAYFDLLLKEIHSGGQEAFLHHLMNLDISSFDVRKIPNTESATKLDHKIRTADSITKWWIDVLDDGRFKHTPEDTDMLGGLARNLGVTEWPDDVGLSIDINNVYESYVNAATTTHIETKTTLKKKLKELCPHIHVVRPRNETNESRPRHYQLPSLQKAREAMDERMGQKGPWWDAVQEK